MTILDNGTKVQLWGREWEIYGTVQEMYRLKRVTTEGEKTITEKTILPFDQVRELVNKPKE